MRHPSHREMRALYSCMAWRPITSPLSKLKGGWTPLKPLRGLQEIRVATREESGVLGFPLRQGLTPRGSLEWNPDIPAFPGEEY